MPSPVEPEPPPLTPQPLPPLDSLPAQVPIYVIIPGEIVQPIPANPQAAAPVAGASHPSAAATPASAPPRPAEARYIEPVMASLARAVTTRRYTLFVGPGCGTGTCLIGHTDVALWAKLVPGRKAASDEPDYRLLGSIDYSPGTAFSLTAPPGVLETGAVERQPGADGAMTFRLNFTVVGKMDEGRLMIRQQPPGTDFPFTAKITKPGIFDAVTLASIGAIVTILGGIVTMLGNLDKVRALFGKPTKVAKPRTKRKKGKPAAPGQPQAA